MLQLRLSQEGSLRGVACFRSEDTRLGCVCVCVCVCVCIYICNLNVYIYNVYICMYIYIVY